MDILAALVFMDERVKLTQQILSGIRIVKMFAWEDQFASKIHDLRSKEMVHVRHSSYAKSGNLSLFFVVPTVVALATFSVMITVDGERSLSPATVFTALAYFNVIMYVWSL